LLIDRPLWKVLLSQIGHFEGWLPDLERGAGTTPEIPSISGHYKVIVHTAGNDREIPTIY
jgi:hypothetical protein